MLGQCSAVPEAIGNIARVRHGAATLAEISKAEIAPQPHRGNQIFSGVMIRSSIIVRLFDVGVGA